jgi:DNA (cytosine-5)-methyltransferase 1
MHSLELFSGMGGLAKGLEIAGFEHVAFVEFNKDACSSLRLNFEPGKVLEGDIRNFDFSTIGQVDIVAGGPPCQPFSLGGKHRASDDSRDMFPHAIRAIHEQRPRAFIFENVKGLLRPSFSEYFDYIILRLRFPDFQSSSDVDWKTDLAMLKKLDKKKYDGIQYDVTYKLVNAADYGVPQTRERVIIVGVRADLGAKWTFPAATHSEDRLLWDKFVTEEYWERHNIPLLEKPVCNDYTQRKIDRIRQTYNLFPPDGEAWRTIRDALKDVPDPRDAHSISDHIFKDGARSYPGHTGSEIDWPSKTIKAGGHGVPGGENMIRFEDDSIRYLTVYEAKLLQTFPKDFIITGAWGEAMRQIGNAVPVTLAEKLGRHLYNLIAQDTIIPTSKLQLLKNSHGLSNQLLTGQA